MNKSKPVCDGETTSAREQIELQAEQTAAEKERGDETPETLVALAASLLNDDDFIETYVLGNEKVERAVVDKYLRGMARGVKVMPRGSAAIAPMARPRTLSEAKRACEEYLKNLP